MLRNMSQKEYQKMSMTSRVYQSRLTSINLARHCKMLTDRVEKYGAAHKHEVSCAEGKAFTQWSHIPDVDAHILIFLRKVFAAEKHSGKVLSITRFQGISTLLWRRKTHPLGRRQNLKSWRHKPLK